MTPEEIARIAKSLTKAQLWEMRYGRFPTIACQTLGHPTRTALRRKELCTFTNVAAGRGDWKLTAAGLAVRAHLLEQESNP